MEESISKMVSRILQCNLNGKLAVIAYREINNEVYVIVSRGGTYDLYISSINSKACLVDGILYTKDRVERYLERTVESIMRASIDFSIDGYNIRKI